MKSILWRLSSRTLRSRSLSLLAQHSSSKGRAAFPLCNRSVICPFSSQPSALPTNRSSTTNSTLPRTNISLLGAVNAGKSVLMNLLTQSEVSLVHDTAGTTADPKICAMELHGKIGPIRLLDTPGINEAGDLGHMKKDKAMTALSQCDVAIIVCDPFETSDPLESTIELLQQVYKRQRMNQRAANFQQEGRTAPSTGIPIPLLIFNLRQDKVDALERRGGSVSLLLETIEKRITEKLSAATKDNKNISLPPTLAVDFTNNNSKSRDRVIQFLERFTQPRGKYVSIVPDFLTATDTHGEGYSPTVLLNIPMDQQTPSMRLLRPQAMTQEALLRNYVSTCCYRMDLGLARHSDPSVIHKERERFLRTLDPLLQSNQLKLIITDSQAIDLVAPWTLDSHGQEIIPITTFSIAMIRYLSGGRLNYFAKGLCHLDQMMAGQGTPKNGDKWRVLISEACNHTRLNLEKECADIGTVQIPRHLLATLGGEDNVEFEYAFGKHAIFDPSQIDLVIHCGGCMLTPQQMDARIADLVNAGVPATNYGLLLSRIQSPQTLARVLKPWGIDYDSQDADEHPPATPTAA